MTKAAQSLATVARRLEQVPDAAVAQAAEATAADAAARGGRFAGKRMGAAIKGPTSRGGGSTVRVLGRPAGGWAIKSYGRGVSRARPGSALPMFGTFRMSAGPATGDRRWDKVVATAQRAVPGIVAEEVTRAVTADG